MNFEALVKEIMWEYDCRKQAAISLIEKYQQQGKYNELIDIVKFKRTTPQIERRKL